jgi:RNAse (barnase) inhibitor barstar
MQIIELDATNWKTVDDFYDALLTAIGAPEWHGRNLNALLDSMIWGGINAIEPPYTIRISGLAKLPNDIRNEVEMAKQDLAQGRMDFRRLRGRDIEVIMETDS